MKPYLSSTTLLCVDCLNISHAIKVVDRCKSLVDFADVKLLTSLPTNHHDKVYIAPINTLVHYSIFMLKLAHEYIDTPHCLVVQRDGWILNPDSWTNDFLNYDYIGPLFNQFDQQGVGGFSFRSAKLMQAASMMYPAWDGTQRGAEVLQPKVGMYEDGAIAVDKRNDLINLGFKYAPLEVAAHFAQGGNPNNNYYRPRPFGFHGSWRTIDQHTGLVGEKIKHDGEIIAPI
jgi:hypothetical protein